MCGVVGYVGKNTAQDYLVSSLKRLEYRGYDSAGIATLDDSGEPHLARAVGKIKELEQVLEAKPHTGSLGIGHTRWATHGGVSVKNAHPHRAGDIFLVHNGIIENFRDLRDELKKEHDFKSDTDTEVLAALVNHYYEKDAKLEEAVSKALARVRGTYGIAAFSTREPGKIVVARMGSPLIIGLGDGETLIASDASAFLGYTREAIYLNDGEMAVCTDKGARIMTLSLENIDAKAETIEGDVAQIQKGGFDHFLLKEIMEQGDTLKNTLSGRIGDNGEFNIGGLNLTSAEMRDIEHIVIVGCGTAYYAGLLASYYFEQIIPNVSVEPVVASEYRYRSFHLPKNSVALIVSQSGETADTLACLRAIQAQGVKALGIVNVVGSTIARESDGGAYIYAGPEISVASTKAFTAQVATMLVFAGKIAESHGASRSVLQKLAKELKLLPDEIAKTAKNFSKVAKEYAAKYAKYNDALYLGRDTGFPIALEGALKLKEISYIHAEGYATGELKHGPIALIDDRFFEVINILEGDLFEKSLSGLQEILARGGEAVVITNSKQDIKGGDVVRINTKLDLLAPLVINVFQQLFAYYVSVERGNDVDQPRNLAKSVTVE